jgi:hypothetical protein
MEMFDKNQIIDFCTTRLRNRQSLEFNPPIPDWCLTTDPQSSLLEPFIFMHIPKTAGSTLRLLIMDLFDKERIYPGFNYDDYLPSALKTNLTQTKYSVFVGHMTWDAVNEITSTLGTRPRVFTVLRDPASHSRSQMAFLHLLLEQGVKRFVDSMGSIITHTYLAEMEKTQNYLMGTLAQQVCSLLGFPYGKIYNSYCRQEDIEPQINAALDTLIYRIHTELSCGFFEDLRKSVDLLCAQLSLPYKDIPIGHLNASKADHTKPLTTEQICFNKDWKNLFFEIYAHAKRIFDADYASYFSGINDIRSFLDNRYRLATFTTLKRHWCISLRSENAWPGTGWSLRITSEHGPSWRHIGSSGCASILAILHTQLNYELLLKLYSVPSRKFLNRLIVKCNGTLLISTKAYYEKNYLIKRYLIPDYILFPSEGNTNLTFELDEKDAPLMLVSSITVIPTFPPSARGKVRHLISSLKSRLLE